MVNQRQPLKVQADKKNLRKVESTPVELAEELTGLERLPGGPMLAFGGGGMGGSGGMLGGTPGPAQGGLGLSGMMAMALQQQMQEQQQVFQMMSNMMKMQHQAAMAVIRNIR